MESKSNFLFLVTQYFFNCLKPFLFNRCSFVAFMAHGAEYTGLFWLRRDLHAAYEYGHCDCMHGQQHGLDPTVPYPEYVDSKS